MYLNRNEQNKLSFGNLYELLGGWQGIRHRFRNSCKKTEHRRLAFFKLFNKIPTCLLDVYKETARIVSRRAIKSILVMMSR